jgi:hypothetical protein
VAEKLEGKTFDLDKITKLAEHGLTDAEIADILDVDECTVNRWKADPDFMQALKKGKEYSDSLVERKLYERAIGYNYTTDRLTKKGDVVTLNIHVPPEPICIFYWLNNRKPEIWRNRKEVTIEQEKPIKVFNVDEAPDEVIDTEYNKAINKNVK